MTQLFLHGDQQRLRSEQKKHDRLLDRITKKRARLAAKREAAETEQSATAGGIFSTIDEAKKLTAEILDAFAAFAKDPRWSKRQRTAIQHVERSLRESGLLYDLDAPAPGWDDGPESDGPELVDSALSAAAPADELRAIFRKLAEASHPDKARDDADRLRRTEVMKKLTVAYRAGDMATLVELARGLDDDVRAPEATCEALVRRNAALRKQERQLDRELRAIDAMGLEIGVAKGAVDALIVDLRKVRDFVLAFRDGKLGFDAFLMGPELGDEGDEDEDDWLEELVTIVTSDPASRRKPRRRR